MTQRREPAAGNEDTAFEASDLRLRAVGLAGLGVLLLLVVAPLALSLIYAQAVPDVDRAVVGRPPAPRLQIDPAADLSRFRAAEAARLNGYGWVDRSRGIVHIPIAQAMQELARRGIADFQRPTP